MKEKSKRKKRAIWRKPLKCGPFHKYQKFTEASYDVMAVSSSLSRSLLVSDLLGKIDGGDHWSGTTRKYADMAFLNRFLYCFGEITVGETFLGPPKIPEALTHVSRCLSHVYCLIKSMIPNTSSCFSSSTPTSRE